MTENGIHHVLTGNSDEIYCYRKTKVFEPPITVEHALVCIEKGTYLQPCKNCMNKYYKENKE